MARAGGRTAVRPNLGGCVLLASLVPFGAAMDAEDSDGSDDSGGPDEWEDVDAPDGWNELSDLEVDDPDCWNVEGSVRWNALLPGEDPVHVRRYIAEHLVDYLRARQRASSYRSSPSTGAVDTGEWGRSRRRGDGAGAIETAERWAALSGVLGPGECSTIVRAMDALGVASGAQDAIRRVCLRLDCGQAAAAALGLVILCQSCSASGDLSRLGPAEPPALPDATSSPTTTCTPGSSHAHAAGLEGDGSCPASSRWGAGWPDHTEMDLRRWLGRDAMDELATGILGAGFESHPLFAEVVYALGGPVEYHEALAAVRICEALQLAACALGSGSHAGCLPWWRCRRRPRYALSSSTVPLDVFPGSPWPLVVSPVVRLLACGGAHFGVPVGDYAGIFLLAARYLGLGTPPPYPDGLLDDLVSAVAGALSFTERVGALYDCCLVHLYAAWRSSTFSAQADRGRRFAVLRVCWIRLELQCRIVESDRARLMLLLAALWQLRSAAAAVALAAAGAAAQPAAAVPAAAVPAAQLAATADPDVAQPAAAALPAHAWLHSLVDGAVAS